MLNKVWFRTGIALIIYRLIKLFMEVHEVFTPIATIIGSVFLPLIHGFLFIYLSTFSKLIEKVADFQNAASLTTIMLAFVCCYWLKY